MYCTISLEVQKNRDHVSHSYQLSSSMNSTLNEWIGMSRAMPLDIARCSARLERCLLYFEPASLLPKLEDFQTKRWEPCLDEEPRDKLQALANTRLRAELPPLMNRCWRLSLRS